MTLLPVTEADHACHVLQHFGRTYAQVVDALVDGLATWMQSLAIAG